MKYTGSYFTIEICFIVCSRFIFLSGDCAHHMKLTSNFHNYIFMQKLFLFAFLFIIYKLKIVLVILDHLYAVH